MCFVFVSAHDAGKFFSLLEFVPTFWSRAVYYSQGQSGHSSSWYVQKSSLLFVKTDQNILFPMNCIAPDTIWIPIFTRLSQRFVWCWKQVDKYTCKVMACFFNSFIIHAFNAQSTVHKSKAKVKFSLASNSTLLVHIGRGLGKEWTWKAEIKKVWKA